MFKIGCLCLLVLVFERVNVCTCQASIPSSFMKDWSSVWIKAKYDYNDVISKSVLFFESQRSGRLWNNNRVKWRGNSAVDDNDGGQDLAGGYYTAEDAVKMTYSMSWATTMLSWGVLAYTDGYTASGQLQNVMTAIRWSMSFIKKAVGKDDEVYAQIGSKVAERGTWRRPESFKGVREYYKTSIDNPGTELLAETSAAMTATALIFKSQNDANSANELIETAKSLFASATSRPQSSQSHISHDLMKRFGIDNNLNDDLAWAAAWLYRYTKSQVYHDQAIKYYNQAVGQVGQVSEFSWSSKLPGVMLLMEIASENGNFLTDLKRFCDGLASNKGLKTPRGFLHGSGLAPSMIASNAAFLCHRAADLPSVSNTPNALTYRDFARAQLHYLLGDAGRSYLVGFGQYYPQRAFHKGSSCPLPPRNCGFAYRDSPQPNVNLLIGALVSGPNKQDQYFDVRRNLNSFVGIEFNAGFQSAIAGLRSREVKGDFIAKDGAASTDGVQPSVPTVAMEPALPFHDYEKVIHLSLLFYEAQRSGKLPSNNRIPWRRNAALTDRGMNGEDLSGGYFDGSGYVKYSFPLSFTLTLLSWGGLQYKSAYVKAGEMKNLFSAVKWGTDFLINCHPSKLQFYAQVGASALDEAYWGRAEDMTMARPAYMLTSQYPGTEVISEATAALAAASLLFQKYNPSYSKTLLLHAKDMFEFASGTEGYSKHSIPDSMNKYATDSGYQDELVWAAAWMYKATDETSYLLVAESKYIQNSLGQVPLTFFFDDKTAGAQILLAQVTDKPKYKMAAVKFCDSLLKTTYTPKGLIFLSDTDSNKHAANVAFICLLTADLENLEKKRQSEYRKFAAKQIGYMLGDGGESFVVGYGSISPKHPYHKGSSCPSPPAICNIDALNQAGPNPHVLSGALVGGPNIHDNYKDVRTNYQRNSVSLDLNAGFQSALAGLSATSITETSNPGNHCSSLNYNMFQFLLSILLLCVFTIL